MNNCFIILAAGESKRFNSNIPKSYQVYKGKPVIYHSIDKALKCEKIRKIVVVTNKKHNKFLRKIKNSKIKYIYGGTTRAISSLIALKSIKRENFKNVLIHDAARPNFSIKLLKNLIKQLKNYKAVVPFINSRDSIKYKVKSELFNLDRDKAFFTQTPQAFKFKDLYELSLNQKNKITDEVTIFINRNYKVKFIQGEEKNNKITYLNDIITSKTFFGIGFDIHRLIRDKKLYLGGVEIPFHSGLKGHSDGDVIIHSVIDSILGAMKKKDIGTFFPDNQKKFKNIRSPKMLKPINEILNKKNYYINNLDINLICEQPKVSKYRDKIIKSLSSLLGIDKELINLKGKTVEKLGLIGKEKAIACEVICSISEWKK